MNSANQKVSMDEIVAFVRGYGWRIALRGALSLAAVIALLALYYAFAPRIESYRQEVAITLDARDGHSIYPNDRLFSSTDLVSAPVLNRVWTERKLADRVKFDDFCKWFSLIGYDRERTKLDAEYQTKMSKRNITVTELAALQSEYEAKLAAQAADNRYMLAMKPSCLLTREESVEILASVPAAWFAESSILNAPQMPSMMCADALTAYVRRLKAGDGRALEMVDALRLYHGEIAATCKYIRHKVLRGRNVQVDGMDIGSYEARLDMVRSELVRVKNKLLVNGDPADLGEFVTARLDDMACETMEAEEKAKAIRQTIDLLKDTAGREADGVARSAKMEGSVTLQADASFFKDFTAMVRRDASQEAVQKYADELSQYAKELAEIKARKLYYDQIGKYAAKTRTATGAKNATEKVIAEVESYAGEMLDIGAKVAAFRDRSLKIYRTPDQFYALPEPVHYGKKFKFSIARAALGLLALWALYNLAYLVAAFRSVSRR